MKNGKSDGNDKHTEVIRVMNNAGGVIIKLRNRVHNEGE